MRMMELNNISKDTLTDIGVYTPLEAGMFSGIKPANILRWVHGSKRTSPVIEAQLPNHREIITFLDMIQSMVVSCFRQNGIPLVRIREAIETLQKQLNTKYPFARQDIKPYIIRTTNHIAYQDIDNEKKYPIQISGKHKGQFVSPEMLDKYLTKIEYGHDGLASRYIPVNNQNIQIVLDPEIRFGQPIVYPSGHLVQTLFNAYKTEGNIETVAEWYDIDVAQVDEAVNYMDKIAS